MLKAEQRKKQNDAKALLVSQYEAMVTEAEALNAMNEELATKNALRAQQEQVQDQIISKVRGYRSAPTVSLYTHIWHVHAESALGANTHAHADTHPPAHICQHEPATRQAACRCQRAGQRRWLCY